MPVYETVSFDDFEHVLFDYAPCWETIVFAGVVLSDGGGFLPAAVQVWASDDPSERTELFGPPEILADLRMFMIARNTSSGITIIKSILNRKSVLIDNMEISFKHLQFARAAFLGSNDYNYLYPEELHQHVDGWPKLFFEGGFENRSWLEKEYQRVGEELRATKYKLHTLSDASNRLVGFRTSGAYFMGALSGALKIPVTVKGEIKNRKLDYSVEIPKTLAKLPVDLRYIARSQKGDRDVTLEVPKAEGQEDRLKFFSSVDIDAGDEVLELLLILGEKRLDSCRVTPRVEVPTEVAGETRPESATVSRTIEENISTVLSTVASKPRNEMGISVIRNAELQEATGLSPAEINDAVSMLVEHGYLEWRRYMGTTPFSFFEVEITPFGRHEYERAVAATPETVGVPRIARPPIPVGSPYGFTDADWEAVEKAKGSTDKLFIVFGHAFESDHYDTGELKKNVGAMFEKAVDEYNKKRNAIPIDLVFKPLTAGYGEHLFNEIARDVISADIAVFDTSDQNPNVMLEMGVALTWGLRVLPIKREGCPKPPSDISGQTWADYRNSAAEFVDTEHESKLLRMVERAARKKAAR